MKVTYPDLTTDEFRYDEAGNLTRSVDRKGEVMEYRYDALNRLIEKRTPEGLTLYEYDSVGNLIRVEDPDSVLRFEYDPLSRLIKAETGDPDNPALSQPVTTLTYLYLDTPNRIQMTSPAGDTLYDYQELDPEFGLQFDRGNVASLTNPFGETFTFTYDHLGRRTSLTHPNQVQTTYDLDGNLKTKTEKTTNQVTTYTYDSENQLVRIDLPTGSIVTYRYDGLGRRIEKNVDANLTRYVYDQEDILLEYDGVNQIQAYYTHGPGIDEPLSMARDLNQDGTFSPDEHFFYHTDALGSVTALTDFMGNMIESYQYDSFGSPIILDATGSPIPQSAFGNPFLFTSREFDPESGLYFNRRRYYDPRIGRFLQRDPFASPASDTKALHPYMYVLNNPVGYIDPGGESAITATVGGGIILITTIAVAIFGAIEAQKRREPASVGALRGAIRGFAGSATGVGVSLGTRNPVVIGSAASSAAELAGQLFDHFALGKPVNVASIGWQGVIGAFMGPILSRAVCRQTFLDTDPGFEFAV